MAVGRLAKPDLRFGDSESAAELCKKKAPRLAAKTSMSMRAGSRIGGRNSLCAADGKEDDESHNTKYIPAISGPLQTPALALRGARFKPIARDLACECQMHLNVVSPMPFSQLTVAELFCWLGLHVRVR